MVTNIKMQVPVFDILCTCLVYFGSDNWVLYVYYA